MYYCAFHSVFFDGAKLRKIFQSCKSFLYYFLVFSQFLKSTSIVDGRDEGSDMGEMKGEMKMTRILCLKGLAPSDGRDGPISVNKPSLSVNNASLFFNKAPLLALHQSMLAPDVPLLGTIYSHLGNVAFPAWEQNIPSVGIIVLPEVTP